MAQDGFPQLTVARYARDGHHNGFVTRRGLGRGRCRARVTNHAMPGNKQYPDESLASSSIKIAQSVTQQSRYTIHSHSTIIFTFIQYLRGILDQLLTLDY